MEIQSEKICLGFILKHTLKGHTAEINKLAWSADGKFLVSASQDGTAKHWDAETGDLITNITARNKRIYSASYSPNNSIIATGSSDNKVSLWNLKTRELEHELKGHRSNIYSVAWSPKGDILATASKDQIIILWNIKTGSIFKKLEFHTNQINALAWSPDGNLLASSSDDGKILIWDANKGKVLESMFTFSGLVSTLAWSPNGSFLASSGSNRIIRIWDPGTGELLRTLEGHSAWICSLSFSFDGSILASKSLDNTVRLWRSDTWETLVVLPEMASEATFAGISFHPAKPILATLTDGGEGICIWEINFDLLLNNKPTSSTVHYLNAKVVLLGDTGVGKSGLGLVLTNQPWIETGSTHGRHVRILESNEVKGQNNQNEIHEILLWDLAGQPDYRIIHQLHLAEITLALIIFDSRSQTDPFSGIFHWVKALDQAQKAYGNKNNPTKRFLVAARTDVGRIGVSKERIEKLKKDLNIAEYYETSAKEGWGIKELSAAIRKVIDWQTLPRVSSTKLFLDIKNFLIKEKESGRLISSVRDLYLTYKILENSGEKADLQEEFDTCIRQLESRGLIKRLSFGNLILLQPELLDVYASAMSSSAKGEPDGLGCLSEELALSGNFLLPQKERIKDKEQEKILLISTIEELLRHEIALREQGRDGSYLVFPSHLTREIPTILINDESKSIIYYFEGAILNIYSTLAVRLSYSGMFKKKEMWKNLVMYSTKIGGTCGILLREIEEGSAELALFFDPLTSEETRFYFEEFIEGHLRRHATEGSTRRQRLFVCQGCGIPVADLAVKRRKEHGYNWISCNVCEPPQRISLLDHEDRLLETQSTKVSEMNVAAHKRRNLETAVSILQGKKELNDFDVFLCHNHSDKSEVKRIGEMLKEKGLLPWLDEWELRPGKAWQRLLEHQISKIKSAAVFIGGEGVGPWQREELDAFMREFVESGKPVIPVVLPNAHKKPELPIFLRSMTWVDFRIKDPNPLAQLIWGITGEHIDSKENFYEC